MTKIIDGKKISSDIKEELKIKTRNLMKDRGIQPGLAVLLVGDDPASQVYVNSKQKACERIGYKSIINKQDSSINEEDVLSIIEEWNNDVTIHGMLVQSPLPSHINENNIILAINPIKDVDGFHPVNVGKLVIDLPCHVSCTPAGIVELLKRYDIETRGKHVVVVGRSNIVGKPIANLMYQKKEHANSVVTICHSACQDISKYTRDADILIVAVGRPEMIKKDDIKDGAIVIDVGINRVEANNEKGYLLVGDVDFSDVFEKASAITPVPGGVGPMTIAMLLSNTFDAAEKS